MRKIRLGVNIDHAATLRQVRGGTTSYPDLQKIARIAVQAGADQITLHLREDRRHIQDFDLQTICKRRPALINLEMAATEPMLKIALKNRPDWICFVPESRQELTTEGGLDVQKLRSKLLKMSAKLKRANCKISMFIEPSLEQVYASYEAGADAVEFHTGHWVLCKGKAKKLEWQRLVSAAKYADELGLAIHAGHGLDYSTLSSIVQLPFLQEVNIGHSIICYSLEEGLSTVIRKMKKSLRRHK